VGYVRRRLDGGRFSTCSPPALAGGSPQKVVATIVFLVTLFCGAANAQPLSPALAARFDEGVAALEAGRLDAADASFREILRAGGDRPFVHHNLGIALQRRGRHDEAIAEFRIAARQDPSYGPAFLLAGASLLALGRPSQAIADLERAVKLMPRELAPRLQLADACERTGNVRRLVAEYREIVALAPDDPEYGYRLGKAYLRLSQWSFERIKALEPQSARLSQALAGEYLQQGRPDLALAAYQEAAARDPALVDVQVALARLHVDAQRWREASEAVDRALALAPESAEAKALQATITARAR
jgi:tetratricopeptide (TPR) repeat protein